mmetsp:Transcript_58303/g.123676  ORF Transcript_58303/g.123676 Transcript_58303/m.123676 type:complete len:106 (-) Transcript_58303:88-405(-)
MHKQCQCLDPTNPTDPLSREGHTLQMKSPSLNLGSSFRMCTRSDSVPAGKKRAKKKEAGDSPSREVLLRVVLKSEGREGLYLGLLVRPYLSISHTSEGEHGDLCQ